MKERRFSMLQQEKKHQEEAVDNSRGPFDKDVLSAVEWLKVSGESSDIHGTATARAEPFDVAQDRLVEARGLHCAAVSERTIGRKMRNVSLVAALALATLMPATAPADQTCPAPTAVPP